jgi:hypothetical protein
VAERDDDVGRPVEVMVDDVVPFPLPLDAFDRSRGVGRKATVDSVSPGGFE